MFTSVSQELSGDWPASQTGCRVPCREKIQVTGFEFRPNLGFSLDYRGMNSWKLTWHPKIDTWKRSFLLETIILRFHVSFRECIYIEIYVIWMFPKIWEKTPNHPFVHRVWNHYFHHPFWGNFHTPIFGSTPIYWKWKIEILRLIDPGVNFTLPLTSTKLRSVARWTWLVHNEVRWPQHT